MWTQGKRGRIRSKNVQGFGAKTPFAGPGIESCSKKKTTSRESSLSKTESGVDLANPREGRPRRRDRESAQACQVTESPGVFERQPQKPRQNIPRVSAATPQSIFRPPQRQQTTVLSRLPALQISAVPRKPRQQLEFGQNRPESSEVLYGAAVRL